MDGSIEGFERQRVAGHGVEIDTLVGGSGPPLLLLHGYPQTRVCWKAVAPRLAERFTVVVPDLRGYGRSDKPAGDDRHEQYSKRTMALDQIAVMGALGHDRFAVAGHDRGARVAYRLSLDHPEVVTRVAVLDIIPTTATWAAAHARSAMASYHWYFLAQPEPLPETLLAADPAFFIRWTLRTWVADDFVFDADSLDDYVACFSDPACIHATCEDYRAGWTRDREYDDADEGRHLIEPPLLALWGEEGNTARAEPLTVWARWARNVRGHAVPGGHFLPEEAPDETAAALGEFFANP